MPKRADLITRLMRKVTIQPNGCWTFNGTLSDGYGRIWDGTRLALAHRTAYSLLRERVDASVILDHTCHDPKTCSGGHCDHRRCCNPDHLEKSEHKRNCSPERKSKRKSGWMQGVIAAATVNRVEFCLHGHPMKDPNIYYYKTFRKCLACQRNRSREYQRDKRAKALAGSQLSLTPC